MKYICTHQQSNNDNSESLRQIFSTHREAVRQRTAEVRAENMCGIKTMGGQAAWCQSSSVHCGVRGWIQNGNAYVTQPLLDYTVIFSWLHPGTILSSLSNKRLVLINKGVRLLIPMHSPWRTDSPKARWHSEGDTPPVLGGQSIIHCLLSPSTSLSFYSILFHHTWQPHIPATANKSPNTQARPCSHHLHQPVSSSVSLIPTYLHDGDFHSPISAPTPPPSTDSAFRLLSFSVLFLRSTKHPASMLGPSAYHATTAQKNQMKTAFLSLNTWSSNTFNMAGLMTFNNFLNDF